MARLDSRIALLLEILDSAFVRKAWHGTTLRGSLRGLLADEALWRSAASTASSRVPPGPSASRSTASHRTICIMRGRSSC